MPDFAPPSGAHSRLFLALWPDDATRIALAAWQHSWNWPAGARVVRSERLHLTLHFLGDVPATRVAALSGELRHLAFEPFPLEWGRGELWPGGIAVARPERIPGALDALHAALGRALVATGLAVDARPFKPHVTLARKAQGAVPSSRHLRLCWPVNGGVVLACSLGGAAGYALLERFG